MSSCDTPWLVIGLGNPGPEYAHTRHNVGQMAIAALTRRCETSLQRHRSRMKVADVRMGTLPGGAPGPKAVLAQSTTYMNVSGSPVGLLARFLGVGPERMLVIHDDLDLAAHELRLKKGGGEGGHNGLKSISQNLGTRDYCRLRVGIGRPPGRQNPADYVLGRLGGAALTDWEVTIEKAADVVEDVIVNGFVEAQQRLHSR